MQAGTEVHAKFLMVGLPTSCVYGGRGYTKHWFHVHNSRSLSLAYVTARIAHLVLWNDLSNLVVFAFVTTNAVIRLLLYLVAINSAATLYTTTVDLPSCNALLSTCAMHLKDLQSAPPHNHQN